MFDAFKKEIVEVSETLVFENVEYTVSLYNHTQAKAQELNLDMTRISHNYYQVKNRKHKVVAEGLLTDVLFQLIKLKPIINYH